MALGDLKAQHVLFFGDTLSIPLKVVSNYNKSEESKTFPKIFLNFLLSNFSANPNPVSVFHFSFWQLIILKIQEK